VSPRGRPSGWIGLGLAVTIACLGFAATTAAEARPRSFASPEEAFDYLHQVARNPRCVNCHGLYRGDGERIPTVGDAMAPHPMNVTARHNPNVPGSPLGTTCTSCHGTENAQTPGGPPGALDKPFPWQMPTRSITRLPPDVSKQNLCKTWRAAVQHSVDHREPCGDKVPRTAAEFFVCHIGGDALIGWAFAPGPGRTPAPGSLADLIRAAEKWAPMLADATWCDTIKERR